MELVKGLKAVASGRRLRILELLRNPEVTSSAVQSHGVVRSGATATALRKRLGISQPALSEQMQILLDAGLVEARNVGRWVVYSRDEERIRQLKQTIIDELLPPAVGRLTTPGSPAPDRYDGRETR